MTDEQFMGYVYNPISQAVIMFIASIVVTLIAIAVDAANITEIGERFPWLCAASFLFMYAIFNSLSSLVAKESNKYWGQAIMGFMGLAASSGLLAYLFSGLSIWEAGSYSWIYVVISVGYLIFLGMMGFIKSVVAFAQKEEWNQPRIKDRKRK